MNLSKEEVYKKFLENLKKTEAYDLVFLYNTEFAKLDNYRLIKMQGEDIIISKSNNTLSKDSLIDHMMSTIKTINRNHFVAAMFNLISTCTKIKYDYENDAFIKV